MCKMVCKECGKTVIVHEEKIHRICGHDNAPVIAELSATCTGEAALSEKK